MQPSQPVFINKIPPRTAFDTIVPVGWNSVSGATNTATSGHSVVYHILRLLLEGLWVQGMPREKFEQEMCNV